MRARSVMPLFLFALLFAGGCQQFQQVPPSSHEADIKALRDVEIAEQQAFVSKDPEKWLSFFADDAALLYPNMPAIVGKDNIRAYMKMSFADPALTCQHQITSMDVAQSGDLGYTQGTVSCTMSDPKTGKPTNERGKWLTIRKRQADGSWKMVLDTWNSDLPLPSASK